ncbi:hypothetical protein Vadar_029392 [Vaccinium darrowii]|uniref:Uncharacterized protein n=1 Tax=Vaccinium darrowii TaxID=229202 RepID=A0ACB7ZF96_9ERIC|nr:hypothetical protein Vadar_029392 [Vaccinium darrowii]
MEWLCYDSDGMEWIDVPRQPKVSVNFNKTLAVGTELLVFGGNHGGLEMIHKFSAWTNSWSLGREMNELRFWFGSVSLGRIAIVARGMDAEYNILSS